MFTIGCHISKEGGYRAMGERILSVNGCFFQYFTKNPQGKSPTAAPDPADVESLRNLLTEHGMPMPLAHAPYTYNPCSQKEDVRRYSLDSMHSELEFLEALPGSLYNFHPGCHVGQGVDTGIAYISDMLNHALWPDMHTTVLLETMSGKGSEIGRNFEELRAIIDRVEDGLRDKMGICLDTCHVHDAGYDIVSDLDGVLREFDRVIGMDRLKAIHLNDSKNPAGSHKDRHEKIGDGAIGLEAIERIINHPLLRDLPFCLETPNELDGYGREIALLKNLRK